VRSMGSVNFVVIVESARDLLKHGDNSLNNFHVPSIVGVAAALGVLAYLTMLVALTTLKVSSFFCFSTAIRHVPSRARLKCSGKTTVTTCL